MRATLLLGLASLVACSSQAPASYDLVPLWETFAAEPGDTLYTTDFAQRQAALAHGAADHGVVAWLPCAQRGLAGPLAEPPRAAGDDNLGYPIPMQFACAPPPDSRPLYRYTRDTPPRDRVYTTAADEAGELRGAGYVFDRVEGHVFARARADTQPLYRLGHCDESAAGCDAAHRYTTSRDTRDTLLAAGWRDEGVTGHVFTGYANATVRTRFTGTLNGSAVSATTPTPVSVRDVVPPTQELALHGRGRDEVFGEFAANTTARPVGADRQRLRFALYTGDLFASGSNLDHIPVWLYGHAQFAADGQGGLPYDGLGLFFSLPQWGGNRCGGGASSGGQIFVEMMGPVRVDCAANLARPLEPERWYDISLTVTDRAELSYTIVDRLSGETSAFSKSYADAYACPLAPAPGTLALTQLHCNNPFTPDRFPAARTGYFIWPIFTEAAATSSGRLAGLRVDWLAPDGRVLSAP